LEEFDVKIENVVVFATLGKDIPLDKISKELVGAEYTPEAFPGVIYRIKDPKTAALIFSSGKIVCTGARSPKFAKTAVQKVVDDMKALNIDMPDEFHTGVENIVASTQIEAKDKLNLEFIAYNLENAEYEPEQFPGLVYRISDPRVAFLLFGTGKIICTGARKIEEIHAALQKFKTNLEALGIPVKAKKRK
jgi:transcription initiation factor TFIID TATA-box-binding protein